MSGYKDSESQPYNSQENINNSLAKNSKGTEVPWLIMERLRAFGDTTGTPRYLIFSVLTAFSKAGWKSDVIGLYQVRMTR